MEGHFKLSVKSISDMYQRLKHVRNQQLSNLTHIGHSKHVGYQKVLDIVCRAPSSHSLLKKP